MKVLELFAGSRSFGKVAEERGHEVISVDFKPFEGIDIVRDIDGMHHEELPWTPDMIWASPPCTTYSIAGISHHRKKEKPISEFAKKSDNLVRTVLAMVANTGAIYYLENPRGYLRKMSFMSGIDRGEITYCSYGDTRMKPTDIFTNNLRSIFNPNGWNPRPQCFNGNPYCHHERAPRGSRTGTQGLKGNYERSKIPEGLCQEVLEATERVLEKNR